MKSNDNFEMTDHSTDYSNENKRETVGAVVIFSGRPGPELQSPLWRAVWEGAETAVAD